MISILSELKNEFNNIPLNIVRFFNSRSLEMTSSNNDYMTNLLYSNIKFIYC